MKVLYVAAPYRAPSIRGVVLNIRAAEAIAVELWRLGAAVVCPHLNVALLDGSILGILNRSDDELFLNGDFAILERCDAVVASMTAERSVGATAEIARARELGFPVFVWPRDRNAIADYLVDV